MVLIAFFLNYYLERRINSFKEAVIIGLEKIIDRTITYETISPSIFQYIEIRKLYITDPTGKYALKIEKFRINFSLSRMFFLNKNPIDMIYLENSSINLDTGSDENIIEIITNAIGKPKSDQTSKKPINNFSIKGRNISITTASDKGIYRLNKIFADLRIEESKVNFLIKTSFLAENISYKNIGVFLTTDIKIEGFMDLLLQKHDYNFEITNLKTDNFNIKKQNLNIQYQDKKISVRKVKDRAPIDLIVEYDFSFNIISASAKFENYSPTDSGLIFKSDNKYPFLFKSKYTGNIDLLYHLDNDENKLSYNGDIISSLDKTIFPLDNNFSISFYGDNNYINFSHLLFETEKGKLSYTGLLDFNTFLPAGTLTLADFQYGSLKSINSQLIFEQAGKNSIKTAINIEYGNKTINIAELKILNNNKRYSIQLYLETEEGGILSYSGFYSNSDRQYLESAIVFENFGLDYIADIFLLNIFNGKRNPVSDFNLDASIKINTNFKTYNIASNNIKIFDISDTEHYISTSINIDDKFISVSDMVINLKDYKGAAKLYINKTSPGKHDLESLLIVNNEIYNFAGIIYPGAGLLITGNYDFYFSLFQSDTKYVFYIFSEKLPIFLPNKTISYLSLRVSGYNENNGKYKIVVHNNTITGIKTSQTMIDVSLSCYIINNNIRITRITYTDSFSKLNGIGDIFLKSNQEIYGWTYISDTSNREKYLFNIDINKDFYSASIDFNNSLMQRINGQQALGKLSGQLVYKNQTGFPEVYITASTNEALLFGTNFLLNFDFYLSNKEISINRLELEYGTNRITNGRGYINRVNRDYRFTSKLISSQSTTNSFESNLILNGELSKTDYTNNLFDISLSQFTDGIFLLSNVDNNISSYDYWLLSFINTKEYFSVLGGPENSINVYYDKSGSFDISLKEPLPLNGLLSGTVEEGNIQATFKDISLNLNIFTKTLSKTYFKPIAGIIKGTLNISGKVVDPDFSGELSIEALEAISPITPHPIEPLNSYIVFDGKSLSIPDTLLRSQRSKVLFQMDALIDRWIPREYIMIFRTPPGGTVWVRDRFGSVDVNGYASGEIAIEENNDITTISGRIIVSRTIVTMVGDKDENEIVSNTEDSTDGTIIDLELVSGSGIDFYWPSLRIPILRASAAVGQQINIYSDSVTNTFSMTGSIKTIGGEILYFNQNFFLKEGVIYFDEDEDLFDPHITARAEMRERTADNRDIKIFLVLNDCPLSKFSPRFESNPPLSEFDIYNLLGQGIYNQLGGENITIGSAIVRAGSYSTHFLGFLRPFETGVKNLLNLDFFLMRTQFLQRAFLYDIFRVRDLSYTEDQGLNTYLDNTSIFMGKYFGDYFFLQGLLRLSTLDFDRPRYSYYDIPDFMGMYLETDISLEVDTPLVLIDFRFYPQIANFYDSLLDTTLQLSWRFSF
ncbi:MAG: translocation/assembly module TamB [Spirochaetaceae bacterium]|nr:translocation/assembly module TamB [Spirochaetaceae bacterium]